MSKVYSYRSKALHEGRPFPAPMCLTPLGFAEVPVEIPLALGASMLGGTWIKKDVPMLLHTFEYIARQALLRWWQHVHAKNWN